MSVNQSLILDSFQIYILNLTVVGYLIQKVFFTSDSDVRYEIPCLELPAFQL